MNLSPLTPCFYFTGEEIRAKRGKESLRAVQGQPASGLPCVELRHTDSFLPELSARCYQERDRFYWDEMGWTEALRSEKLAVRTLWIKEKLPTHSG